jgi:hypothetical protein
VYLPSSKKIVGPHLRLRLVEVFDASYVHSLRTDPTYNTHLSAVRGGVAEQTKWIETYKIRELVGQELYYVIERHDGTRCGLVRLYNIRDDKFSWGSWILDANKPPKAALESALLSFGMGFEVLQLRTANIDVRLDNVHATAFYRRLGMTQTGRTAKDLLFIYERDRFRADREKYFEILRAH